MNQYILYFAVLLSLTSVSLKASETTLEHTKAKVLWSAFDGEQHTLLTAHYYADSNSAKNGEKDTDKWSSPSTIHESENPMTSVTVGSTDNNTELLVWTEQIEQQSQLFHKWFSRDSQTWSQATLLSDLGDENIGASIVVDPAKRLHLFWSANQTDFSDIVHMTYAAGRWSEPETIHPANEVPDIKPEANLDLNGNVVVTWSSYSFDAGQYVELQTIIETGASLETETGEKSGVSLDSITFEQVDLPDFLPSDSTATLYFPHNIIVQSVSIEP